MKHMLPAWWVKEEKDWYSNCIWNRHVCTCTFGKAIAPRCGSTWQRGVTQLAWWIFSRPFIYTTALPESSITGSGRRMKYFRSYRRNAGCRNSWSHSFNKRRWDLQNCFPETPIQGVVVPGNEVGETACSHLCSMRGRCTPDIISYSTEEQWKIADRITCVQHQRRVTATDIFVKHIKSRFWYMNRLLSYAEKNLYWGMPNSLQTSS